MSSGGKGSSSASKSYNYFGTVAGAVCFGPVDAVLAVIADGKAIWESPTGLAASGAFTNLTGPLLSGWLRTGGYLRIYWGTQDQVADPALPGHPAYRGICYVVANGLLFGKEKTTAPNLEVVVRRRPRPPVEVVHPDHTQLVDGQANPIAIAAELLGSQELGDWPIDRFAQEDWLAVAAAVYHSTEARATSFVSPLLANQREIRSLLPILLDLADAWTRESGGIVAVGLSQRGHDDSSLPLLAAPDWVAPPKIETPGWTDVPPTVVVKFHDRDRWKDSAETWDNPVARAARQVVGAERVLDLPWVTRRDQAQRIAAAWTRRYGAPGGKATVRVRESAAIGLQEGDRVRLDLDPHPSDSLGLAVAGLIVAREEFAEDAVSLEVELDRQSNPTPFVGDLEVLEPQIEDSPPVIHAMAIPLPPAGWGMPPAIGVLAARPSLKTTGFRVFFAREEEDDFLLLGSQNGFAARVTLGEDVGNEDGSVSLSLTDGDSGPDAHLLQIEDPEDALAGRADRLLLVLVALDSEGLVELDTNGLPRLEIISLFGSVMESAPWVQYQALRGRLGTFPRNWAAEHAVAWVVPAANLAPWRHPDFEELLAGGTAGYLQLQSFTAFAVDESAEPPLLKVGIPAAYDRTPRIEWVYPTGTVETDSAGAITISATVTDREGDLIYVGVDSALIDGGSQQTHLALGVVPTTSRSISGPLVLAGSPDTILAYMVRIEARDQAGNTTVSTRTVIRPASDTAGNLSPPIITGVTPFTTNTVVNINAGGGGLHIEYAIRWIGEDVAGGGGEVELIEDFAVNVFVNASRRVWARSLDVVEGIESPWVFADFIRR